MQVSGYRLDQTADTSDKANSDALIRHVICGVGMSGCRIARPIGVQVCSCILDCYAPLH